MSLTALNLLLFGGEVLAASILLPLMAWSVNLFFRERAARRHLIWLAVFGALLLLPLFALLVPSQLVVERAGPSMMMAYESPPLPVADVILAPFWNISTLLAALVAVWGAGVAWNLLRLALGMCVLHRLRRRSTPFGNFSDVRLAASVPLAFGWLKPVILLPLDAPSWPRERLDAVLGHERAHVCRHDNFSQMVALLACAVYWFNPFLWLARDAMCRDAEIAADDFVLASGMKPSAYAAELVELAAEYCGHTPAVALAMASPSSLEVRVTSILSPTSSRKGVTGMDFLKIACLGSAAALMLAFARPGIAEAQSPAPPVQVAPFAPAMPDRPEPPPPPGPPPAPPTMPVIAAPPVPPAPIHAGHAWPDNAKLSPAEKARIEAAVTRVKAEMERVKPELDRIAAHAGVIREQLPAIRASARMAMTAIGPVIHQAVADARIQQTVAVALARAQVDIDRVWIHSEQNDGRDTRRAERARAYLERAKAKVERALADVRQAEARVARLELEAARDAAHAESEGQRRAQDAERQRGTRSPE